MKDQAKTKNWHYFLLSIMVTQGVCAVGLGMKCWRKWIFWMPDSQSFSCQCGSVLPFVGLFKLQTVISVVTKEK
jgi:putative flippase GtrA